MPVVRKKCAEPCSGVTGDALDLSEKLGGDQPTVLRVVVEFTAVLTSLSLADNHLCKNK